MFLQSRRDFLKTLYSKPQDTKERMKTALKGGGEGSDLLGIVPVEWKMGPSANMSLVWHH